MADDTFPTDLLESQVAWHITYGHLAHTASSGTGAAAYRPDRRPPLLGNPAARVALKETARTLAASGRPPG